VSQLLAGIRVLELATGISGPYLGKLFADHGAEVTKVEPPSGDPARAHGPWGDAASPPADADSRERSPLFLHLNTNKRSVIADIGSPTPSANDIKFVRALVAESDIVVEAFPAGHLDSIGLGYDVMCTLRPGIVLTSITPFGQTGPYADAGYRGSDIVTYAMGGPMWGTGIDEREPVKLSGDVTSYQVGNLAAVPTLAALMMSQRHGRPSHIDVSAFEAQAGTIDRRASYLLYEAWTGTDVGRTRASPNVRRPLASTPPRTDGRWCSPCPRGPRGWCKRSPTQDSEANEATVIRWLNGSPVRRGWSIPNFPTWWRRPCTCGWPAIPKAASAPQHRSTNGASPR